MVFPNLMTLMTDRPLDELYHCWQLAMDYVERHAQSREQLREAKKILKRQLREFTTGEPASPCSSISSLDDPPSKNLSSSLHPLRFCPARPDAYPHEVLWTYEDYKEECSDNLQLSGSVAFGIRHANGRQISQTEWTAIAAVVKYVEYDLLVQTNSRDATGKLHRKTDFSIYKWYHRAEWNAAIEKLEKVCPILGLCAHHWKAEMVLRWALHQPGDPHDPKRVANQPFGFVEPNVCKAEGRADGMFMGSMPAIKRSREVSFTDSYPNKRLPVWRPPLLPQLFQNASGPSASAALLTTSTSTCNISPQPSTTTFVQTSEEATRISLETKLGQLYKADIYDFVVKRQLASIHKRTLKKDLVTIVVKAALVDKSITDDVDKMFSDLPQKRINRRGTQESWT